MANTEDGPTVTAESQENGGDSIIATNVDDYNKKIATLFDRILKKLKTLEDDKKVNKTEEALVTNITSDLGIVKELVSDFCTEDYIKEHVEGKVDCIGKEVDLVIDYLKEKEEQKRKIKLIKTSECWYSIAKRTEIIKKLVSQFPRLSSSTSKQKTLSNTMECHNMCIEESLLISPIVMATLKKSYHHLPPELRLCLLSLSAFPENFIIKKRPLIYWWMAEGFVAATSSSKLSAEEVGEQNFTQLIQMGLIQPWYEAGNNKPQTQFPHVQGCQVHPWIRRMLVSIAMEAQLLEFYGADNNKVQHEQHPRSPRVCLYDDEEGADLIGTWETRKLKYDNFRDSLKWVKAKALAEKKNATRLLKTRGVLWEMVGTQEKLSCIFQNTSKCLIHSNNLLAEVSHEKKKVWSYNNLDAFNQRLNSLTTRFKQSPVRELEESIDELHDEQMKLLKQIVGLLKLVQDLEVYNRSNSCESLQENEKLFRQNDLNNKFPFPCMKKRASDVRNEDDEIAHHHAKKLLAIINVRQSYLNMEPQWFGKMERLQTIHLGRWQDSSPNIPTIVVKNTLFLDALFRVAKHLKYLSLRGISRITELPKTISNCTNLQILDLKACYNLEKLPSQISPLSKLTHFDVSECYLLPNTNLWSLVESLEFLQTLKGLRIDESSQNSLQNLMSSESLRKLSIILTTTTLHIDFSNTFRNLRVLTITWRTQNLLPQQPEKSEDSGAASTENPQQPKSGKGDGIKALTQLKKLDLRCYPYKAWPHWLKKHTSLETLYITGGNIEEFPKDDLNLRNLKVLRLKYLSHFKLDFSKSQLKETKFPSLTDYLYMIKSSNP